MNGEHAADKIKYRLYAAKVDRNGIIQADKIRFARITPKYILLYTEKMPFEKCIEIAGGDLKRLTGADRQWLFDCNAALLAEDAALHEKEITKSLNEMINRLETALKEEVENNG